MGGLSPPLLFAKPLFSFWGPQQHKTGSGVGWHRSEVMTVDSVPVRSYYPLLKMVIPFLSVSFSFLFFFDFSAHRMFFWDSHNQLPGGEIIFRVHIQSSLPHHFDRSFPCFS